MKRAKRESMLEIEDSIAEPNSSPDLRNGWEPRMVLGETGFAGEAGFAGETELIFNNDQPLSEFGYCLYRSPFPSAGRALGIESFTENIESKRSVTKIISPGGSVLEIRAHR